MPPNVELGSGVGWGSRPKRLIGFFPQNWLIPRETRYVELYVIADSQEVWDARAEWAG